MRRIIVLDVPKRENGDFQIRLALWLDAPEPHRPRRVTSVVPNVTLDEQTLFDAGAIVERVVVTQVFASGTNAATQKAAAIALHVAAQAEVNVTQLGDKFIGASWDGTSWTVSSGQFFEPQLTRSMPRADGVSASPADHAIELLSEISEKLTWLIAK